MAASVYATPPPDLSGEDTALSDVSNSSQITTSSNSTQLQTTTNSTKLINNNKRTLSSSSTSPSSSLLTSPQSLLNLNHTNIYLNNPSTTNNFSSNNSQLLDTVPDPSKKRRKQSTPFRISATLTTTPAANALAAVVTAGVTAATINQVTPSSISPKLVENNISDDNENHHNNHENDDRMEKDIRNELSPPPQNLINDVMITSVAVVPVTKNASTKLPEVQSDHQNNGDIERKSIREDHENNHDIENQITIKTDLKKLQGDSKISESGQLIRSNFDSDKDCEIIEEPRTIKEEHFGVKKMNQDEQTTDWNGNNSSIEKGEKMSSGLGSNSNNQNLMQSGLGKPEDWLALTGLPFPFPPEAAAALSAGYLPQLPLLGVPSMSHFTSVEGLSRPNAPPLRIFNPEAYCDLCNKEFCNKYFLKTHKANKHGIYEPPVSASDMPTTSQLTQMTQMSQVFQMQQQMQQQVQQAASQQGANSSLSSNQLPQQQQSQSSSSPLMPPDPGVFCDICFKRFTNVIAMRKHRINKHEMPQSNDNGAGNKNSDSDDGDCFAPFRMPDGFREDFTIEQEEVSFTPQPRKLSPSSSQQARDANFSSEKLKRLGVINPEAFCEMCCKEYCNKYFLRTHKLKRHGIFIPSDELKENENQPHPQHRNPWHYVQTSPLNLMMGSLQQQHQQLQQQIQMSPLVQLPQRDRDDKKSSEQSSAKIEEMVQEKKVNNITIDHEKMIDMNVDSKIQKINDHEDQDDHEDEMDFPPVECKLNDETTMKSERKTPHDTPPPSSQDSDAISVDLQKLQSMILQLNDLSSPRVVSCGVCGKDMDNQYMLHAHMIAEHSNLGENNNGMKRSRSPSPTPSTGGTIEVCKHCEKEFTNLFAFKQHLYEMHGISSPSPKREGFLTPDRPIPGMSLSTTPTQGGRPPYTITPTSSYCEICNKELCNKYFMKTHMQRMHGIEIENGAQIGGVVCNICNKELCSKYFLRVHKHNTHGIVEEGSPLPQPRSNGEPSDLEIKFSMESQPPIKSQSFSERDGDRYTAHYTEVCPICSRRFKNTKWLRSHLMNDHGKIGTEKLREVDSRLGLSIPPSPTLKIPNGAFGLHSPESSSSASQMMNKNALTDIKEFFCSYCQFSTPYFTYLIIHERSHLSQSNPLLNNQSESAVSLAKDQERLFQPAASAASSSDTPNSTPASTPVPQTPQDLVPNKIESGNILNELANLTQRPAIYALPQETGPMIMQSFLIEETTNQTKDDHQHTTNAGNNRFVPAFVFFPVKERISTPITVSFTLTPA